MRKNALSAASLMLILIMAPLLPACSIEVYGLKNTPAPSAQYTAAPSPSQSPTPEVTAEVAELTEIYVPAIFFMSSTFEAVKASAEQYGVEVTQNADGSCNYKMTKEQQEQLMSDYKEQLDATVGGMLGENSAYYPEIKDIRCSEDYGEINIVCDRAVAEESPFFSIAVTALGLAAPIYQAYQGKGEDAISVITLEDAATGAVYQTYKAPYDFAGALTGGSDPVVTGGEQADVGDGESSAFAGAIAAGVYSMKLRAEFGAAFTLEETQVASGGKTALVCKQSGLDLRYIAMNGVGYCVDDSNKVIYTLESPEDAMALSIPFGFIQYRSSGTDEFLGKDLPFDEYDVDGCRARMFVDDGALVGIMLAEGFGEGGFGDTVFTVLEFSFEADESVFELPEKYKRQ